MLCISAFIAVSCSQKADNKNDTPEKPNIIIIFSDELMFEDISCCGGSIQTPNIDALAAGGLLFENTFTPAPMCTPSRFALLTGNYPGRCTHQVFIRDNPTTSPYCITWNTFLDSTNKTLPGILSDNGYITGMAGKWHLGEQFLRGYLAPDDSPEDPEVNEKLKKHQELVSEKVRKDAGFDVANSVMYANYDGFPVKALQYHNYPWVTKGAVDFIEQHAGKEKPFFLYLAGTSVHGPHHAAGLERDFSYTPGGKIDEVLKYQLDVAQLKSEIEGMESPASHRYCGMAFLDHQVGLIVNKLEELNITDNTLSS